MRLRYLISTAAVVAVSAAAALLNSAGDTGVKLTPRPAAASAAWSSADFMPLSANSTAAPAGVAAASTIALEQVPSTIDSTNQAAWWVPLARYGGATYFVFNTPSTALNRHDLKIARRDDATGAWTIAPLRNASGAPWAGQGDDLGHRQPTIAIDGDGYIHVWADMHTQDWVYFRSAAPGDISDIRRQTDLPGGGTYTYPVAKTSPNGDIWLMARNNAASSAGVGELHRWNNAANSWAKVADFGYDPNGTVYPDDIAFTSGSVNLLFEWSAPPSSGIRHRGSYLRYTPGTASWSYVDGTAATLPVNLADPRLFFLPLQEGETMGGGRGMQSAKVALDSQGFPTIGYRYRPTSTANFNVYRVRWNGSAWVNRELVYDAASDATFAALGISRNATTVRIYFASAAQGLARGIKTGTTPWTVFPLAPGKAVQRLAVTPFDSAADIVYASAPTEIDANSGNLYWLKVAD